METQHNAFLNSASHFYGRSTGRVGNSAQRFPELSVSLLRSFDRSRWKLSTTLS
ncbi:hypothetical protein [Leptospira noguchii]|uniref:hypothetical protein n=1 Tax=Leptospira noguchii TaxID=28182 RepID=UPI0015EFBE8C|nr:hypothetical protein [Leptospira noguchii]UOG53816.1 hypothetical protein MAL09_06825 [Leptospira noguchii]UOG53817.1 hypothetical protein MAL09_06830 [Leptospira noguchii]